MSKEGTVTTKPTPMAKERAKIFNKMTPATQQMAVAMEKTAAKMAAGVITLIHREGL